MKRAPDVVGDVFPSERTGQDEQRGWGDIYIYYSMRVCMCDGYERICMIIHSKGLGNPPIQKMVEVVNHNVKFLLTFWQGHSFHFLVELFIQNMC